MAKMTLNLVVWRQADANAAGRMVEYVVRDASPDMSFLEMLDVLNEDLIKRGEEPIAFDSDCREGICGSCGVVIDGVPHGPEPGTTVCQLHLRHFRDGETVAVEPWRAASFPVQKDLVVDRSALDRIMAAGGYVSFNAGGAPDGNAVPISKSKADAAFDVAACIGCGACVAACKNASAALFTAAKISHLALLPQGAAEREQRVLRMVAQHDKEGFGACSNEGECQAVCPKEISIAAIARMHREVMHATVCSR
ncbi:MAG: succinate dehydrogenase/fumarate reductase iron-sulfur subunit [Candidatus Schekmanbacteria bacterium]|nr:succinate dehydrogenase/fumarate reductase iron-sulfur subunit [Candidatus Schekmanbacteria bacterium]